MLGKFVGTFVAVAAAVLAGASADAQVVDLSTIKCKDFVELPKDTVNAVTMWLDGYYTDEEDPAAVDFDKLKAKAEKLAAFCVNRGWAGDGGGVYPVALAGPLTEANAEVISAQQRSRHRSSL
jgi:acid stress chaperone HdeB